MFNTIIGPTLISNSFRLNKTALLLWFITISHSLIVVAFQLSGVFRFTAAGYANRIWALLVIIFFLQEVSHVLLKPKWPFISILLLILLGIVNGNQFTHITADFMLLFLPLIFFTYGKKIFSQDDKNIQRIFKNYLVLNIFSVFIIVIPARAFGLFVQPDYLFISAALIVIIFNSKLIHMFSAIVGQIFIGALFATTKTYLIQLVAAIVLALPLRQILRILMIILVIIIIGNLVQKYNIISQIDSLNKMKLLVNKTKIMNVTSITDFSGTSSFNYVDISTAQRIFELSRTSEYIQENFAKSIIGMGLGGSIDISETLDKSVLRSHVNANLGEIRVVHLGITYSLLKGGIIGLFLYVCFIIWLFFMSFRLIIKIRQSKIGFWVTVATITLAMYLLGSIFTFSNYFKMPGLWIMLAFVWPFFIRKNI